MRDRSAPPMGSRLSRRHFGVGAAVAAGAWVAPSVIGLDRVAAATPSGGYTTFYTEDFQGAVGGPGAAWSTTITDVPPADANRRFLGQFNADTVTLSLSGLPAHDCLCIEFDFYAIQSWDGNNTGTGPDALEVVVDGALLFSETFGHPGQAAGQSYPGPSGVFPAQSGAVETGTLGYTFFSDTVYRIVICDIAHTASTATISISDTLFQSIGDESWGIDNFFVGTA